MMPYPIAEITKWFTSFTAEARQYLMMNTWPEFCQMLSRVISAGEIAKFCMKPTQKNPMAFRQQELPESVLNWSEDENSRRNSEMIRFFISNNEYDSIIIPLKFVSNPAEILRFIHEKSKGKCFSGPKFIIKENKENENEFNDFTQFPSWLLKNKSYSPSELIAAYFEYMIIKRYAESKQISPPIISAQTRYEKLMTEHRKICKYWVKLDIQIRNEISLHFANKKCRKAIQVSNSNNASDFKNFIAYSAVLQEPLAFIDLISFIKPEYFKYAKILEKLYKLIESRELYDLYDYWKKSDEYDPNNPDNNIINDEKNPLLTSEQIKKEAKFNIGKYKNEFCEIFQNLEYAITYGKIKKQKKKKKKKKKSELKNTDKNAEITTPEEIKINFEEEDIKENEEIYKKVSENITSTLANKIGLLKCEIEDDLSDEEDPHEIKKELEKDKEYIEIQGKLSQIMLDKIFSKKEEKEEKSDSDNSPKGIDQFIPKGPIFPIEPEIYVPKKSKPKKTNKPKRKISENNENNEEFTKNVKKAIENKIPHVVEFNFEDAINDYEALKQKTKQKYAEVTSSVNSKKSKKKKDAKNKPKFELTELDKKQISDCMADIINKAVFIAMSSNPNFHDYIGGFYMEYPYYETEYHHLRPEFIRKFNEEVNLFVQQNDEYRMLLKPISDTLLSKIRSIAFSLFPGIFTA